MQTIQGNMLQSLRTVQAFLEENAAKLTDVVNTGARQRRDDAIAELSGHASDQTGSALASQGAALKQRTRGSDDDSQCMPAEAGAATVTRVRVER